VEADIIKETFIKKIKSLVEVQNQAAALWFVVMLAFIQAAM